MFQFLPRLRAAGIDVVPAPLIDGALLHARYARGAYPGAALAAAYFRRLGRLLRSRSFDLLWIEYELFPWLPGLAEALLARVGPPFVVEYDDAVFHRYDHHPRTLVRALLSRKIDRVMRRAASVIAGNAYLATRAASAGARRVVEIPSVVDTDVYVPALTARNGPPVIGWIGSPTTAAYLRLVEPAIAPLVVGGRARVVLVGADGAAVGWSVPSEMRDWDERREVADIQGFDIGIMPLPDEPWERGKCGYKLVQYMACGKPVVASPVGVNREVVRDGVDGYLADSQDEWRRALERLLDHPDRRDRMGREGRARVERGYSTRVALPRLIDALSDAAGAATGRP